MKSEAEILNSPKEPLTVSAAMSRAKSSLEQIVVRLVGEVSEVNAKAGYKAVYFTVKDENAALPCMMWMNRYHAAGIELSVGCLVELTGRFTLYAPKGRMNFDVFSLALAGEGNLRVQVSARVRKLQGEGLMDATRKRELPQYPETVGLVTSPRGAAVHDVLRTLRRRWPYARVVMAGVPVEGVGAPSALVAGLQCVCEAGVEVVLLVRGGGSFEDLMPFNDEGLARAIAAAPVPVVTGIGHEPDTTIADLVSDMRTSTPTAAAEAVSPAPGEVAHLLIEKYRRLYTVVSRRFRQAREALSYRMSRPVLSDPHSLFATDAQTLDYFSERLMRVLPANLAQDKMRFEAAQKRLSAQAFYVCGPRRASLSEKTARLNVAGRLITPRFQQELELMAARLHDLSPLAVISRGFALAKNDEGAIVKSVCQAPVGSCITVSVSDGTLHCRVDESKRIDTSVESWKEVV